MARWRAIVGPNTAERTTLHIINKSDAPGNLAMDDLVRAIGQAPDITVPFDRDGRVARPDTLGNAKRRDPHDLVVGRPPRQSAVWTGQNYTCFPLYA